MNSGLNYCCPKCKKEFGVAGAALAMGAIQLTGEFAGIAVPVNKRLIHIACPDCHTIVSSIHIP